MVTFGEVARQVKTKVNPADTDLDRYVGLEHLDPESLQIRRWGVPEDVTGEKIVVRKDDIIFGKRRAYQRKVAIANFDCICSAHAMVLQPKEDVIIKEIFPFFLQSGRFMNRAVQISVGGLSPTINWKDLARQEFPLPSIDEQRRIAKILWAAEDVIVKNETFLEQVERMEKIMTRDLFSRGIGHTEFKKVEKLGMIPKEWSMYKIDGLKSNKKHAISMGPFGSNITADNFVSTGTPVIRGKNLDSYVINESEFVFLTEEKADELIASNAFRKDIVITHRGTLGQVAIIPEDSKYTRYVVSQSQMKLTCNESIVNPYYLNYFLNSSKGQNILLRGKSHTGVPAIAQPTSHLKEMTVPIPNKGEQKQIVQILDQVNSTIDTAHENVEASKALKMRLINLLLSPPARDGD